MFPSCVAFAANTVPTLDITRHCNGDRKMLSIPINVKNIYSATVGAPNIIANPKYTAVTTITTIGNPQ